MDFFDNDLLQLWESLKKNKVDYIMVGGFATNIQGYSRVTADVDIWLNDTLENRNNTIYIY